MTFELSIVVKGLCKHKEQAPFTMRNEKKIAIDHFTVERFLFS